MAEKVFYVAHWRQPDNSASGVLPWLLTEKDKKLISLAEEHFGFQTTVEFTWLRNYQGDE